MTTESSVNHLVEELQAQGLTVKTHNALNSTWFIKGDGIYVGYIATSDELTRLKKEERLDLRGIKSLG
jgi:hypothetical protein